MAIFRIPINLAWTGPGSPGVNVWHVRDDAWPGSTSLDGALTTLSEAYALLASGTSGIFPPGMKTSLGDVIELTSQEYVQPSAGAWTDTSTTGTSGYAPAPVMIVCSWKTSLAARRGMGRTFFGPLRGNILQTDGTPADGVVDLVRSVGQKIVDHNNVVGSAAFGIYGAESKLTEAQRLSGDYPRVLRDITGFKVRDQYAVLRSRRD
jgi:hypothetical protein